MNRKLEPDAFGMVTKTDAGILGVGVVLVVLAWYIVATGYVLVCGWGWFVADWIGIESPTIWVMCGIAVMVECVMPFRVDLKNQEGPDFAKWLAKALLNPPWHLFIMWLIHLLIGGAP